MDRNYGFNLTHHLQRLALSLLCLMMLGITAAIFSVFTGREEQVKKDLMGRIYSSTGRIVAIDDDDDLIVIKSGGGVYWKYNGVRDFRLNDPVSFLVDDGGTFGNHADDTIMKLHYAGGI